MGAGLTWRSRHAVNMTAAAWAGWRSGGSPAAYLPTHLPLLRPALKLAVNPARPHRDIIHVITELHRRLQDATDWLVGAAR